MLARLLKLSLLAIAFIGLSGAACSDEENNLDDATPLLRFVVQLSGGQEAPPVDTEESGVANISINEETGETIINVKLSSAFATAAHLHKALAGLNGPVFVGLEQGSDASEWSVTTTLTPTDIAELLAGQFYINIHSDAHRGGELRGQVLANNLQVLFFKMEAAQEVPPNGSNASGAGAVTINTDTGEIQLFVTTDAEAATQAHIHNGPAGKNGGVLVGLEQNADNMAIWQTPAGTIFDSANLALLNTAQLYVNLHTETVESGELRGQILPPNHELILFKLEGRQEVPPVSTAHTGFGAVSLNTATGGIELHAQSDIDDAVFAHIHQEFAGNNGGVIVTLELEADSMNRWQTPANTTLTAEQVTALQAAGLYVNLHSSTVESGELRAQIVPDGFSVFNFETTGFQEVPPVNTEAFGTAGVTLNNSSGHIVVNVQTNVGDAISAHIHQAPRGVNGAIIEALEQDENDVGRFTAAADATLTTEEVAAVLAGNTYINVHSTTNESGELRGQISNDSPQLDD